MAAACRYAETGVAAAIAPGSQKLNGQTADLDSAPTSTSTRPPATSAPPAGGSASMREIR